MVSPLCPNIFHAPSVPSWGSRDLPQASGEGQAGSNAAQPTSMTRSWLDFVHSLHEASLLMPCLFMDHVLCTKRYHLTPSKVLASPHQQPCPWEKQTAASASIQDTGKWGCLCFHRLPPFLQLHFRCGIPQRCLSVKGKFSLHVPVSGVVGGVKKRNRCQEALRERRA